MNKNTLLGVVLALVLTIGSIIVVRSWLYAPDYPEDVLYDEVTYAINPQTILASLHRGETNVFQPAPREPEGGWPILWPFGSFVWSQENYLNVANALHLDVWKETLGNWHLIRASFQINQCEDIFGKIDGASFSFFQRQEGRNIVHGFWINPTFGIVTAGNQYSHRSGWTSHWEAIDLDKIKINSVDEALLVAEENGGERARFEAKNECRIILLLAPDRLENDFLSNPLSRYSWGWSVIYWPKEVNADPIFSITIDPYTGKYKVNH